MFTRPSLTWRAFPTSVLVTDTLTTYSSRFKSYLKELDLSVAMPYKKILPISIFVSMYLHFLVNLTCPMGLKICNSTYTQCVSI